ncbi:hypothetical protein LR066_03180 [candidate division WOR-3 bacterium]|nr:hypothetical protein [candidate division WOR-3 bacterium]
MLLAIFACFLGCPREPEWIVETSPVEVTIGYTDTTLWGDVAHITLKVIGDHFLPIADTQVVDSTIFVVDVPAGDNRLFTAFGIDTLGVAYFWGRKDTMIEDDTTRISLILTELLIGGGDSVLILRDSLPWGLSCTDSILTDLGVKYRIVPSDSFGPLSLDPLIHTLIIPSDQPQLFYEAYRDHRAKFHEFVRTGGVMFFSACDKGWNEGDILEAGIRFPLGVTLDTIYRTDTVNIVTGNHPIIEDLDTLTGHFASYVWFTAYPEELEKFAQILTMTSDSLPTLLLYPYGSGLVLLSTQPLEYAYKEGDEIGILLPRILEFLSRDDKQRYGRSPF